MSFLSSLWTGAKALWSKFEAWVASWMPGFKTHIVTGLGVIGSAASILQDYVSGLPITTFMNATQLGLISLVLFTLAFWFHNMNGRVEARASLSNPIT